MGEGSIEQSRESLATRRGNIQFPAFFPVTTFGSKYPLDRLIQPYLPRLSQAILVSHHYAAHLEERPDDRPDIPLFIDSGGFALLLKGSKMVQQGPVFSIATEAGEHVTPGEVLERQMRLAEIGATLDFPIPPSGLSTRERNRRFKATLSNAEWAMANNRRRDLPLYASLQCWDEGSAREAAQHFANLALQGRRFAGIAIGGIVPRLKDPDYVRRIIEAVRAEWEGPIHVFGVGSLAMVRHCLEWGADSTDSSSYVRYAASGRSLNPRKSPIPEEQITALDRMQLALRNLAYLNDPTNDQLPLSAVGRFSAQRVPHESSDE